MDKKRLFSIIGGVLGALAILFIMSIGNNAPLDRLFQNDSFENAKDKTFSEAGMSIVLTENFSEEDNVSFTSSYYSKRVAVFALKEEFSLQEGIEDLTLPEYAQLVIDNNDTSSQLNNEDGLTSFEYDKQVNGKDMHYYACAFKASDAFWLIQFACENKYYEEYSALITKWAKSVTV
jgi:hypothetical protein